MINQWGTWLLELANKQSRFILGVMSGTSADAIDLALVECSGSGYHTKGLLTQSATIPWPEALRERFFTLAYRENAPLIDILELDRAITDFFSAEIARVVDAWKKNGFVIDLIAFSGQTVFHRGGGHPVEGQQDKPPLSLQLGNPAQLAKGTGLPVIADFRKDHLALGFEGAPLSPLAEVLLYSSHEPRAMLNLGGIANITILPAVDHDAFGKDFLPVPVPFSSDTGPANTVMDQLVRREKPGETFDRNGQYASRGKVVPELFEVFMNHPFFSTPKPCSTGPEEFTLEWLDGILQRIARSKDPLNGVISFEDQVRTLCELTAITVKETLMEGHLKLKLPSTIPVFASGGGIQNPVLMQSLRLQLEPTPFTLSTSDKIGTDSDMKEALLFAILANERVAGAGWMDQKRQFCLGSLYFPD